jgi:hypothetical protein
MTPPFITSNPQDGQDTTPPLGDAFLSQFDDATIERALKTVHWHPLDVRQFLRAAAKRR